MLLLHQIGSVKIGDVVRYTITYTPAHDRILPGPEHLYLRIRNTSNSALRAAFVHGPYTLYVDAYPAHFDPNEKFQHPRHYGVPEFEPMLKAGGTWTCRLIVPESIRHDAGSGGDGSSGHGEGQGHSHGAGPGNRTSPPSVSWIINVNSQVIFSTSAAVHYEVLLARDPKSLDIGGGITAGMPVLLGGGGSGTGAQGQVLQPGKVSDYQRGRDGHHPDQPKGVFSRAIRLKLEDTATLWNKPQLPGWDCPAPARVRAAVKETVDRHNPGAGGKLQKSHPRQQQQQQQQQKQRQQEIQQKDQQSQQQAQREQPQEKAPEECAKPKKIHLVVLTHGLHGNLGGDMLFIKESIDIAVQKAKVDRKERKAKERAAAAAKGERPSSTEVDNGSTGDEDDEDSEEEVIVRGYSGNATKTERGIKYLGKRLARYVLAMTYPDQPYLPTTKAVAEKTQVALHGGNAADATDSQPSHKNSTIQNSPTESHRHYKFTKISFIAHSLGGLVQTYAVAYIQKHSPQFFDLIQPVNFIAMATPFLGLNHENPMYVKFALDFGLVGRTGQDLGLTWRAPTIARSGWGAIVGNLSENAHKKVLGEVRPESKPLLRILPTGPAHTALKKFRNRTVYSNVVNDGIVPLRTSCLLFLDWQGLGRVEKARREAGLVETVMSFGWTELTGANVTTPRLEKWELGDDEDGDGRQTDYGAVDVSNGGAGSGGGGDETPGAESQDSHVVPQPSTNATREDDRQSLRAVTASSPYVSDAGHHESNLPSPSENAGMLSTGTTNNSNPISNFFNNLFKNGEPAPYSAASATSATSPLESPSEQHPKPPSHTSSGLHHHHHHKQNKIYQRSQTLRSDPSSSSPSSTDVTSTAGSGKPRVTTGQELSDEAMQDITGEGVAAPPRTSFFESATDLINPKIPSVEFLIDPSKRPRAIFHDRVYHPTDIPPPPLKRRPTGALARRRVSFQQLSSSSLSKNSRGSSPTDSGPAHQDSIMSAQDYDDFLNTNPDREPDEVVDSASMKVEEKIARAYHRGLSWRKVLVKLEPDAHNNMVVRRMLANAFGWPVVKHMVDAHFSDSAEARMRDEDESNTERARPLNEAPDAHGAETTTQEAGAGGSPDEEEDRDATPKPFDGRPNAPESGGDTQADEATDKATDLPQGGGKAALASRTRPKVTDRRDSETWSDRDWVDSADESDAEDYLAYGQGTSKRQPTGKGAAASAGAKGASTGSGTGVSVTATAGTTTGPLSPLKAVLSNPLGGESSWNWKEKIVGKQPRSPQQNKAPTSGSSGGGSNASTSNTPTPTPTNTATRPPPKSRKSSGSKDVD